MLLTEDEDMTAVPGVASTLKTLVDGTVRVPIDMEPMHRDLAIRLFGEPGVAIAVARLTLKASPASPRQDNAALYGQAAKALRLSAFSRTPAVWQAIGTDAQCLAWLREQPCAYCQARPHEPQPTEAAPVRRVAESAGVAIKPSYGAIPLCHDHHALPHAKGENVLGGRAWFDQKRVEYVTRWAWEMLKQQLGIGSWMHVPPETLYPWAKTHRVENALPNPYYDPSYS